MSAAGDPVVAVTFDPSGEVGRCMLTGLKPVLKAKRQRLQR